MPKAEFFIEGRIESGNKRQRTHWRARNKADKERQFVWMALMNAHCPEEAFVDKPHQRRTVALCVVRKRELDYDNLVAGLKPFIDVLRCRMVGRPKVVAWEGVIFDDSPKYVKWDIDQKILGPGDALGIHVIVNYELEV